MFDFNIQNTCKKARTGFFNTPHGKLETPNLAIVATHGHIKLLNKTEERKANPDLTISNTFHLFVNKKVAEIKKAALRRGSGQGGLHEWSGLKNPIMTDSGGFQVFSLGWGKTHGIGKVVGVENFSSFMRSDMRSERQNFSLSNVVINERRVVFYFNGKKYELTPEKSMKIQKDLGADIIFAFDECTSPFHSYTYTKKAMERTHRWAIRCLAAAQNLRQRRIRLWRKKSNLKYQKQALFGIVQGGIFEDLRKKSSKFIGALPFEGFGIGGSFGEKEMKKVLGWALSGLPIDKPRHLLGIGKIKNIFMAIRQGIDLFDCVVPTREARHGVLYTKAGKLNIEKQIFKRDKKLIEKNCDCWVCRQGITRQELRHYFKTQINPDGISINQQDQHKSALFGKKLATLHNIYFFKNLFQEIREAIVDNKLEKLEKEYYNYLK